LVFDSDSFVFQAPSTIARARRVLIKPTAGCSSQYPVTTSRQMMASIIAGIRKISEADILILDGSFSGSSIAPIYKDLGYDFPRVLTLDVRDTTLVEVENPLLKPLAVPTFMLPNVILSSDYLISVAPLKVIGGYGRLSISNLLGLVPTNKPGNGEGKSLEDFNSLGIEKVLTDLYYTMPFDLGIIEATQKFTCASESGEGTCERVGKVFVGDPYKVDAEASTALGIKSDYLKLIDEAKAELE